jgi:fimbrial chaperone protein
MSRIALFALLQLAAAAAGAAEFSVSPIRLDFEPGRRSATVSVANDGEQPLRVQLKLMEWTQDADGVDSYGESDELVYFPKLIAVQPKDRRLVRVGLKSPAGATEKTYRLFLDELPDPTPATASGVSFTIRFALPIFLPAVAPRASAAIASLRLDAGKLRVAVANTGNEHVRITSVSARSPQGFEGEVGGWYLLAGATRVHMIEIPAGTCRALRRLEVTVKTDQSSLEGGLDVEPGMCSR